ncbi:squalene/phytoene synthase family protein [Streptomyces aidingensis]|uniref:Phytoene synthase n=1 Tax=Streptomyces aidingensis TaxID=910347 RepID=A0A1I1SD39_9ACTN|nr:squalene/phytoene synthase family protein [Streptomyces aidingensis]SFD40910.1 phytoene synthase [Streptomyces aidingensis]
MSTRELDAAGIRGPLLRHAYRRCRRLLSGRDHALQGWLRSRLRPAVRPYWDAMFAYCGYADDLTDDPHRGPERRRADFDRFAALSFRILDSGPGRGRGQGRGRPPLPRPGTAYSVCLAFADLARTWHLDRESIAIAAAAARDDIAVSGYRTAAELERYMYGVSGQPARWAGALLGLRDDAGLLAWGYGLQTVDSLLDLEEDLRLGKLYLPLEDLRRCGTTREETEAAVAARRATDGLRRLVGVQADRAGRYLAEAAERFRPAPGPGHEVVHLSLGHARRLVAVLEQYGNDPFRAFSPLR